MGHGGDWRSRFQADSAARCEAEIERSRREEFARDLGALAARSLSRLEQARLWHPGDKVECAGWGKGKARLRFGGAGGPAPSEAAMEAWVPLGGAYEAWREGPRQEALMMALPAAEAACLPLLRERLAELPDADRAAAAQLLAAGQGSLESALLECLADAAPGSHDPRRYPRMAMELFSLRVAELERKGMLPAATSVSLGWRRPPLAYARDALGIAQRGDSDHMPPAMVCRMEWRSDPSRHGAAVASLAAGGPFALSGMASPLGPGLGKMLDSRVDFYPGVGPWGMFRMGGIIHGAWIRAWGAQRALENDWGRFQSELAKAHAWLLAEARTRGAAMGHAQADRVELERSVGPAASRAGRATRL